MTTDGALLALIVDDADAVRVLAAWGALGPQLTQIGDSKVAERLGDLASITGERATRALQKLAAARVIVDGGITEVADKMLQMLVQRQLTGPRKRGKR